MKKKLDATSTLDTLGRITREHPNEISALDNVIRIASRLVRTTADNRRMDDYISTAQLGITIASLGLGMYGEEKLAEAFMPVVARLPVSTEAAAHGAAAMIAPSGLLTATAVMFGTVNETVAPLVG